MFPTTWRLPTEAKTPILVITDGCSYGKCSFCSLYSRKKFRKIPWVDLVKQIDFMKEKGLKPERIMLNNGDPFTLKTEDLVKISKKITTEIPSVKSLVMFSSIRNIQQKTEEELKKLRETHITDLVIGVESFYNPSLEIGNVGYTAEEAHFELKRLEKAGIKYSLMLILGLGGEGTGEISGKTNAEFMKDLNPVNLTITTLMVGSLTPLGKLRREGKFKEMSEKEKALELKAFLSHQNLKNTFFYVYHEAGVENLKSYYQVEKDSEGFQLLYSYFHLMGNLPEDTEKNIKIIDDLLEYFEPEELEIFKGLRPRRWKKSRKEEN